MSLHKWFKKMIPKDISMEGRKDLCRRGEIQEYRDDYHRAYLQQVVIEKVIAEFSDSGDPDIRKHLLDILSECKRRKADAFIGQSLYEDDDWFNNRWSKNNRQLLSYDGMMEKKWSVRL